MPGIPATLLNEKPLSGSYLMNPANNHIANKKWLPLVFAASLTVSFFLPWVSWKGVSIPGYYMPSGKFFSIAESGYKLGNPFPQFNFSLYIFWLIPVLALLSAALILFNKKSVLPAFIAGALSLTLLTVYFLFTKTLIDLGAGNDIFQMLQWPFYIAAVSAAGIILAAFPVKSQLPKIAWLLIGPLLAWSGYKMGEKYIMAETFKTTDQVAADYTVTALDLIREFAASDSTANKKYREKMLVVSGTASNVERRTDSSTTINFSDTTGSYAIFSFEKDQFENLKNIKPGDTITVKGSCSGSIYSEILGITSISFKRSSLNKQNQK